MSYQSIIVDRKERVGIITLNRPKQFNTFNTALADELCKALLELEMDNTVLVIVIRGAGKAFCTGIDISEFHGKTLQEYREWVSLMEQALQVIAALEAAARDDSRKGEIIKKGEVVQAVILEVDIDNKRIALGLKQLEANPWDEVDKRRNTVFKRQGEWFFLPVNREFPALEIHRDEPLQRGAGSKRQRIRQDGTHHNHGKGADDARDGLNQPGSLPNKERLSLFHLFPP